MWCPESAGGCLKVCLLARMHARTMADGASDTEHTEVAMSSTTSALQHQPFFEALAACDESSPAWRGMSAGLVTLRLFDAWMLEGRSVIAHDGWGVRSVREEIQLVGHGSAIRALLTSAVDAMEQAPAFSATTIAPRLMAYARALQFDGQWALAADVYRTVLIYAQPVDDADVVIAANMNLGACLRVLADFPEAQIAYTTAAEIATLRDDVMNVLRAAGGRSESGGRPWQPAAGRADSRRDDHARGGEGAAQHSGGGAARSVGRGAPARRWGARRESGVRGIGEVRRPGGARPCVVRSGGDVLRHGPAQRGARRAPGVGGDGAGAVRALGGDDQLAGNCGDGRAWSRCSSSIVASWRMPRCRRRWRRTISYYVGQGYRMFQRLDAARSALRRAIDMATQCGLNQVLIQAEESLSQIGERNVTRAGRVGDGVAARGGGGDGGAADAESGGGSGLMAMRPRVAARGLIALRRWIVYLQVPLPTLTWQ